MTEAHDTDWSVVGVHKKRAPNHSQRVDLRSTIADDSIVNPHRNSVPILLYDMSRDKQEQAIPRYIARRVDIPPQQLDMKVVSVYSPNPHPTKDNLTSEDTSIDERSKLNVDCPEAQLAPLTQRNRSKPKQSTQSQLHIVTAFPPLALPALAIPLILLVCQISVLIGTLVPNHLPKRVVVACVCLVVIPNSFAVALVLKRGIYTTTLAMHAVIWPSIVLMFFMPFTPVLMTSHLLFSALLLLYIMRLRQSMFIFLCSL